MTQQSTAEKYKITTKFNKYLKANPTTTVLPSMKKFQYSGYLKIYLQLNVSIATH